MCALCRYPDYLDGATGHIRVSPSIGSSVDLSFSYHCFFHLRIKRAIKRAIFFFFVRKLLFFLTWNKEPSLINANSEEAGTDEVIKQMTARFRRRQNFILILL